MTDPDWVPVMRREDAIVTDLRGRMSHAAIVSRELGVAAVVGTGSATSVLHTSDEIIVSCAEPRLLCDGGGFGVTMSGWRGWR